MNGSCLTPAGGSCGPSGRGAGKTTAAFLAVWAAFFSLLPTLVMVPEPLSAPSKSRIRSLMVRGGSVRVWTRPLIDSAPRGVMAPAGRYPVLEILPAGGGCRHRWFKLDTEAFACSGKLVPLASAPAARIDAEASFKPGPYVVNRKAVTMLFSDRAHPGRGKPLAFKGLAGFRVRGLMRKGSGRYWRVRGKGHVHVKEKDVRQAPTTRLSGFSPQKIGGLPAAFVLREDARLVVVDSGRGSGSVKKIPRYEAVRVMGKRTIRGRCLLLLAGGYKGYGLRCKKAALATKPPPPPLVVRDKERWLDLDGPGRLLYARRGSDVVRVMLVSLSTRTPSGLFRIAEKHLALDLRQSNGPRPYMLQEVPFVIFFHKTFALHGAYWHDEFGAYETHGCVNLSPADARWVFRFTDPALPRGFTSIHSTFTDLGALVRIRGQKRTIKTRWSR